MLSIFVGGPKHVYFQYSKKNTQQIMCLKMKNVVYTASTFSV